MAVLTVNIDVNYFIRNYPAASLLTLRCDFSLSVSRSLWRNPYNTKSVGQSNTRWPRGIPTIDWFSIGILNSTPERIKMEKKTRQCDYERVFNHFDDDGNGKISAMELRRCLGAMGGELSEAEAEAAVESMDSDGDGELGLKDFVRVMEEADEEEKAKDLREAFKMYEMDGRGWITPKSLKRMLRRLGNSNTTIADCKSMIARFDLDGDGVLDFDEFRIMMS
ncbi:hypothetical protein U1Q18_012565 [Sarracenia purpurea var. burkii]